MFLYVLVAAIFCDFNLYYICIWFTGEVLLYRPFATGGTLTHTSVAWYRGLLSRTLTVSDCWREYCTDDLRTASSVFGDVCSIDQMDNHTKARVPTIEHIPCMCWLFGTVCSWIVMKKSLHLVLIACSSKRWSQCREWGSSLGMRLSIIGNNSREWYLLGERVHVEMSSKNYTLLTPSCLFP